MKRPVTTAALEGEVRRRAIASVRTWATKELDMPLSDLKAELLVDYITAEFGPTFFNLGVSSMRQLVEQQVADGDAALQRDEFPTWGRSKR